MMPRCRRWERDRAARVGFVDQHFAGSGSRPTRSAAEDPDGGHDGFEGHRVVAVTGRGDPRDRSAADVGGEMNLARQPAAGAAQRLSARLTAGFLVIRPCPPRPACWSRQPPRRCRRADRAGRRRHGDGRGRFRHRRPPSIPAPRADRHSDTARPGSPPTYHRLTSGDAGCRRSSSSRTRAADPATATRCASARTRH